MPTPPNEIDRLLAEIEGLTEPEQQDDNDKPPPIRALATDHSAAGRGERPVLLPPPSPDYTLAPGRWIGGFLVNGAWRTELYNEQPPGEVAASLSEDPPQPEAESEGVSALIREWAENPPSYPAAPPPPDSEGGNFAQRRRTYLQRLETARRPTTAEREWGTSPPATREELHSFTLDLMNRMHVNYDNNHRAFNMVVNERHFSVIPEFADDRLNPDEPDLGPGPIDEGLHCASEYVPSAGGGHIRTPTFGEILEYAQTGLEQRHPSRRENRPLIRITPTGYNSPARYQTPLQTQYNRWKQLIYDLPSGFSPEDRQLFREMLDSLDYHRRSLFWARTGEFVTARSFDHGGYELDEVDWDRDESELRDIDLGNFVLPPNLNVIYGEMRMHVEHFQTLERRYSPNG